MVVIEQAEEDDALHELNPKVKRAGEAIERTEFMEEDRAEDDVAEGKQATKGGFSKAETSATKQQPMDPLGTLQGSEKEKPGGLTAFYDSPMRGLNPQRKTSGALAVGLEWSGMDVEASGGGPSFSSRAALVFGNLGALPSRRREETVQPGSSSEVTEAGLLQQTWTLNERLEGEQRRKHSAGEGRSGSVQGAGSSREQVARRDVLDRRASSSGSSGAGVHFREYREWAKDVEDYSDEEEEGDGEEGEGMGRREGEERMPVVHGAAEARGSMEPFSCAVTEEGEEAMEKDMRDQGWRRRAAGDGAGGSFMEESCSMTFRAEAEQVSGMIGQDDTLDDEEEEDEYDLIAEGVLPSLGSEGRVEVARSGWARNFSSQLDQVQRIMRRMGSEEELHEAGGYGRTSSSTQPSALTSGSGRGKQRLKQQARRLAQRCSANTASGLLIQQANASTSGVSSDGKAGEFTTGAPGASRVLIEEIPVSEADSGRDPAAGESARGAPMVLEPVIEEPLEGAKGGLSGQGVPGADRCGGDSANARDPAATAGIAEDVTEEGVASRSNVPSVSGRGGDMGSASVSAATPTIVEDLSEELDQAANGTPELEATAMEIVEAAEKPPESSPPISSGSTRTQVPGGATRGEGGRGWRQLLDDTLEERDKKQQGAISSAIARALSEAAGPSCQPGFLGGGALDLAGVLGGGGGAGLASTGAGASPSRLADSDQLRFEGGSGALIGLASEASTLKGGVGGHPGESGHDRKPPLGEGAESHVPRPSERVLDPGGSQTTAEHVNGAKAVLKGILKRRSQGGAREEVKRVRFAAELEDWQPRNTSHAPAQGLPDLHLRPAPPSSLSHVPDYVRNPKGYTHYTLDWSDEEESEGGVATCTDALAGREKEERDLAVYRKAAIDAMAVAERGRSRSKEGRGSDLERGTEGSKEAAEDKLDPGRCTGGVPEEGLEPASEAEAPGGMLSSQRVLFVRRPKRGTLGVPTGHHGSQMSEGHEGGKDEASLPGKRKDFVGSLVSTENGERQVIPKETSSSAVGMAARLMGGEDDDGDVME